MSKLGKIGLSICGLGIVIGGLPLLWSFYPSWQPVTAPLPLEPGSVLKQTFHVRTSGRYFVEVECKPFGPMKDIADQAMTIEGLKSPRVACDISARILRSGIVVKSEDHQFLEVGGCIGSEKILLWDLLWADLPSAGSYELEIANRSGLKSWTLAEPMVEINRNSQDLADSMFLTGFGIMIGAALFGVGLLIYLIALYRRFIFRRNNRKAILTKGSE